VWLTGPFNLTSHMTLFLARGAVIRATQVRYVRVGLRFASRPPVFIHGFSPSSTHLWMSE
jgi:polygalacturonase